MPKNYRQIIAENILYIANIIDIIILKDIYSFIANN